MLDEPRTERPHRGILLDAVAPGDDDRDRDLEAAPGISERLSVIAPRRRNDAGEGRFLPPQAFEMDEPAAHLKGASRCMILVLDPHLAACPRGEQRPGIVRRRRQCRVHLPRRRLQFVKTEHQFSSRFSCCAKALETVIPDPAPPAMPEPITTDETALAEGLTGCV
jgi:hypothetical protein